MTLEPTPEGRLRVVSVDPGGRAQVAGLEAGDIVAGTDGRRIGSAETLASFVREGPVALDVVDHRSGRTVRVEFPGVTAGGGPPSGGPAPPTSPTDLPPPSSQPGAPLGIEVKRVALGDGAALEVTKVLPGMPAANVGIEVGDVLVSSGPARLSTPEALSALLRGSGSTLDVVVRDVRTGRETPVEIQLAPPKGSPVPLPTSGPAQGTAIARLGLDADLGFWKNEAAVRIVGVTPGGAAERAGLRAGLFALRAGDKPLLHPNDLAAAVQGGGTVRLTVVDPRDERERIVEVTLP
jgi:S1-C subfamily serine protease